MFDSILVLDMQACVCELGWYGVIYNVIFHLFLFMLGCWKMPPWVASVWGNEIKIFRIILIHFSYFYCRSLSTTSCGDSWRLYMPSAALWALQPWNCGWVLLWSWLYSHQWLQIYHLPIWRMVSFISSILCQNR